MVITDSRDMYGLVKFIYLDRYFVFIIVESTSISPFLIAASASDQNLSKSGQKPILSLSFNNSTYS